MRALCWTVTLTLSLLGYVGAAHADRIKDLATIAGVRDNHLTGFGLVVGLDGSGDDARSPMVRSSLAKMLKRLGVTVDPNEIKAKNIAAVAITAELPAFAKPGMGFDVTVSSIGNAKSLAGGTLLVAPLKGPDGNTWALVQGALSVGGFVAEGGSGSSTKTNHVTVGRIPGGAIVEAAAPTVMPAKEIVFVLGVPDFTTASRVTAAIDAVLGAGAARTIDAASIAVAIKPEARSNVPALIAKLEAIEVEPDLKAVPKTKVTVKEQDNPIRVMAKAGTVGDVAAALAALGAKPRDLVSILRALKASGALRASLETL